MVIMAWRLAAPTPHTWSPQLFLYLALGSANWGGHANLSALRFSLIVCSISWLPLRPHRQQGAASAAVWGGGASSPGGAANMSKHQRRHINPHACVATACSQLQCPRMDACEGQGSPEARARGNRASNAHKDKAPCST
jgi:hypothetical protein